MDISKVNNFLDLGTSGLRIYSFDPPLFIPKAICYFIIEKEKLDNHTFSYHGALYLPEVSKGIAQKVNDFNIYLKNHYHAQRFKRRHKRIKGEGIHIQNYPDFSFIIWDKPITKRETKAVVKSVFPSIPFYGEEEDLASAIAKHHKKTQASIVQNQSLQNDFSSSTGFEIDQRRTHLFHNLIFIKSFTIKDESDENINELYWRILVTGIYFFKKEYLDRLIEIRSIYSYTLVSGSYVVRNTSLNKTRFDFGQLKHLLGTVGISFNEFSFSELLVQIKTFPALLKQVKEWTGYLDGKSEILDK